MPPPARMTRGTASHPAPRASPETSNWHGAEPARFRKPALLGWAILASDSCFSNRAMALAAASPTTVRTDHWRSAEYGDRLTIVATARQDVDCAADAAATPAALPIAGSRWCCCLEG